MPLIGVVLGALIGATASFFAGYLADKRKRRMDMIRLRLEKLEEATYALHEIWDGCVYLTATTLSKARWNSALGTRTPEFKNALAKVSTLISLYFPEAREAHEEFVQRRGSLATVVVEMTSVYDGEKIGFESLTEEQKRKGAELIAQEVDSLLNAVKILESQLQQIATHLTR